MLNKPARSKSCSSNTVNSIGFILLEPHSTLHLPAMCVAGCLLLPQQLVQCNVGADQLAVPPPGVQQLAAERSEHQDTQHRRAMNA